MAQRAFDHGVGRGSPYFSRRSRSSEPALTPMRMEHPVVAEPPGSTPPCGRGEADVAGVDPQARRSPPWASRSRACSGSGCRPRAGPSRLLGDGLGTLLVEVLVRDAGHPHDVEAGLLPAGGSGRWSPAASAVSVLVIDWTLIGASPPTSTIPHPDLAALASLDRPPRAGPRVTMVLMGMIFGVENGSALMPAENERPSAARASLDLQSGLKPHRASGPGQRYRASLLRRHLRRPGRTPRELSAHEHLEAGRLGDVGGEGRPPAARGRRRRRRTGGRSRSGRPGRGRSARRA